MSRLKALSRITMVQVSLGVTVVTLCLLFGLVPDHRIAHMEGRERLCEAIALNGATFVHQQDVDRWQAVLDVLVDRHDDLLSAGVRRVDQTYAAESGVHVDHWPAELENSTDQFMQIPINQAKDQQWGRLELRFTPLMPKGILWGFVAHPWTRYSACFALICFPLYYWNLRKVLRQLDPTKAVPRQVSRAYDFLAGGLVALNTQQRIVLCNAAFMEIVGIDRDRLIGKKLDELPWIRVEEGAHATLPWQEVDETRCQQYGSTLQFDSLTHGLRTLMVNAAPVIGQADNFAGTLVGFEDITPLEETKAELEKSKDAAEAANEAKSAFLANMSHEIRTPMNAILGFADIMRRGLGETDMERDEYLGIIHSSGEHLLALINDILDLSKVESGRMQIELIECLPHVIANDTLATLAVRAKEKGLELGLKLRSAVPETIETDPLRLRQVLTNLVGNAIKFTEHGAVGIELELVEHDGKHQLAFHVTDSGIGISQANIERVFQPFSQADSSTTRKYGGTGLGLSISRRLAELMGGGLSATSQEGQGSTFTVTIDVGSLVEPKMLNDDEMRLQLAAARKTKVKKQQLPPGRILVVDDGQSNRHLVRLVMERAGATVDEAVDGQEAVEMVASQPYDIILMDVQMPRMDGTTAARTMRAAGVSIPIVALTAHALGEECQNILSAGYSHLLTKPVNIDELLQLTAELLGGQLIDVPDEVTPNGDSQTEPRMIASGVEPDERQPDRFESPSVDEGVLPRTKPADALESELPIDDEDFREIAEEFATRFIARLQEMAALWSENDFARLATEAHWLKGSGGTAGFPLLSELGRELEKAAKQNNDDLCEQALGNLEEVSRRIWVPPATSPATSPSTSPSTSLSTSLSTSESDPSPALNSSSSKS